MKPNFKIDNKNGQVYNAIIKIGILVEHQNKLLLIKELNSSDGKYYWNIIKGTFESDKDKNFISAAVRECKEEARIGIKVKHLLNIIYLSDKNKNKYVIQLNFIADIIKGLPKLAKKDSQKKLNEDIIELKFFTKKELKKLKKSDLMNERSFFVVRDWLKSKRYNLDVFLFINK
ncbi:MAG: NUDIX hydrolase [Patescibacteria group bacterium]|nr:NUDIX hydrolase [Patescibacteria group bacterium]